LCRKKHLIRNLSFIIHLLFIIYQKRRLPPIKTYKKIVSLDFELYNSMYYWSICWTGVVVVSDTFEPITAFDIRSNPVTRHRFVGKELKFPFTGEEIRREKLFGEVAHKLIRYLDNDTLVVGHAFDNDAKMLIDACSRYRIPCPEFDYVDTNTLYNALFSESGERSLTKLAEKYGIEFIAHDPLEDARATLEVAKKITEGGMYGFLEKHGIEPSRLQNGLIYKPCPPGADAPTRERYRRTNLIFKKGAHLTAPEELCYFDPAIVSGQDIEAVLDALAGRNCGFASTAYSCDIHITNNLMLEADSKTALFRNVVKELSLAGGGYDFTPKKIRGIDNKPIPADEYYRLSYEHMCREGVLGGKGVSFSKAVECTCEFDDLLTAIVQNGGVICFNVPDSEIFVVTHMGELKNHFDGRLRAYRRTRRQQVMTLEEFLNYYGKSVD